jgi:hypothetical protein
VNIIVVRHSATCIKEKGNYKQLFERIVVATKKENFPENFLGFLGNNFSNKTKDISFYIRGSRSPPEWLHV